MIRPASLGPLLAAALLLTVVSCAGVDLDRREAQIVADAASGLTVTSAAFVDGEPIPSPYTCDGENVSPPLAIAGLPDSAVSLAILVDDPDAPKGTWVHWLEFNIPVVDRIEEGATALGREGQNSWGERGYRGPCPPSDEHRYFFKVFALDAELSLLAGADRGAFLDAIDGHVLAYGALMGTYAAQ